MAEYLSEQDQVDLIKKFWKNYGNWVFAIFIIIAFAWSGYRYWQHREEAEKYAASDLYMSLVDSASKGDQVNLSAKAHYLMENYSGSVYAGLGALILASSDVSQQNYLSAEKDLEWVLAHQKNNIDLQSMARVRLARIDLQLGEPQDAIARLTPVDPAYAISFEITLGDAYALLGETQQAKSAYQAALQAVDSSGQTQSQNPTGQDKQQIKSLVQIKLDSLESLQH